VTVTNSRQQHFNLRILPQVGRGDVLTLGLSLHAEPQRFRQGIIQLAACGCVHAGFVNTHALLFRVGQ
jgi:hypothetical protein